MNTNREIYQKKMNAKLDQLNAQIDNYVAQFNETKADIGLKVKERLDELTNQQETVKQKFEEIKSSGEDAWMDLQSGLDEAVDDLEQAYQQAVARVSEITQ